LAGFHISGLNADLFAKEFATDKGMLAYVEKVQSQERINEVEILKHQAWSGAIYIDRLMSTISQNKSTGAMQGLVTEKQFLSNPASKPRPVETRTSKT